MVSLWSIWFYHILEGSPYICSQLYFPTMLCHVWCQNCNNFQSMKPETTLTTNNPYYNQPSPPPSPHTVYTFSEEGFSNFFLLWKKISFQFLYSRFEVRVKKSLKIVFFYADKNSLCFNLKNIINSCNAPPPPTSLHFNTEYFFLSQVFNMHNYCWLKQLGIAVNIFLREGR